PRRVGSPDELDYIDAVLAGWIGSDSLLRRICSDALFRIDCDSHVNVVIERVSPRQCAREVLFDHRHFRCRCVEQLPAVAVAPKQLRMCSRCELRNVDRRVARYVDLLPPVAQLKERLRDRSKQQDEDERDRPPHDATHTRHRSRFAVIPSPRCKISSSSTANSSTQSQAKHSPPSIPPPKKRSPTSPRPASKTSTSRCVQRARRWSLVPSGRR